MAESSAVRLRVVFSVKGEEKAAVAGWEGGAGSKGPCVLAASGCDPLGVTWPLYGQLG